MDIKAIETVYNGYRFRSRLEARWAVFFDTLKVEYQYEPEGFDLGDAGYYLPDFRLPDLDCWIEIKGQEPTEDEKLACYRLSTGLKQAVYLLYGMPGVQDFTNTGEGYYCQAHHTLLFAGEAWDMWHSKSWKNALLLWDHKFNSFALPEFLQMRFPNLSIPQQDATTSEEREHLIRLDEKYYCARYRTERHPFYLYGRHVDDNMLTFTWDDSLLFATMQYTLPSEICSALLAARQSRFEHGETPRIS